MNFTETIALFPSDIPERLGPCRLKRVLGSGGMGTVFLATMVEDRPYAELGARVAVKVLRPELHRSTVQRQRFEREANVGIRLRHPSLVQIHEAGTASDDGRQFAYLIMEYVEGRTLSTLIREMGVVPEALLRHIALQVARSLEVLHGSDVVHRDIKPDNILITPDHQVKVMDFGVAHFEDDLGLTGTGMFIGTMRYAAPEQFEGGPVGPSADLYAFGVTLYEAATGTRPFDAKTLAEIIRRQLNEMPLKAGARNPVLTLFFEELVAQLLEKSPRSRFPSTGALTQVLEACESSDWWHNREQALRSAQPTGRVRRIRTPQRLPLVGRDAQLDTLWKLYEEARYGHGRLVFIEGEAGIGKSRLVDALCDRLESEQVHLLHGSRYPGVLSQAVVEHFGESALESGLVRYLPVQSRLVPSFAASLLGAPAPTDSGSLSAEAVHALFCHLASALASEMPLVWVVEDLHLASPSERAILLSLARIAYDRKLFLICTSQSALQADELAQFERLEVTHRLSLSRLSRQDVVGMVTDKFRSKTDAVRLAAKVASASDGNPFFVAEILREMKQAGRLRELPDGSYEAATQVETIVLPSSVRDLLRARMTVLSPEEQALLEVGAVQGYTFDPDLIARVLERKRLDVLQSLALIERRSGIVRAAGATFQFDHQQLQGLLYDSLPELLRVEYHALLAAAFHQRGGLAEAVPERMPGDAAVFLCRNYLKGGQAPEGMRFLNRAFDYLEARNSHEELLELADLAVASLGPNDPGRRCDIRLRQAACLSWLSSWEAQRTAVEDAQEAAAASGDEARIVRAKAASGRRLIGLGQYSAASEDLEEALRHASRADEATRAEVLAALGQLYTVMGQFDRARLYYDQLLDFARQTGDRRVEARTLADLGVPLVIGDPVRGREYLKQSLAIAREIGFSYPDIFYGNGLAAYCVGDYHEAIRTMRQYLTVCQETGRRHGEALAHAGLATFALDQGRLEEAEKELELCLEPVRAIEGRHLEGYIAMYRGDVNWAKGSAERARICYEEALELCTNLGAPLLLAHANLALGRFLLFNGQPAEARPLFAQAAEITRYVPKVYAPGPLPEAYLALIDGADASTVAVPDGATAVVRTEAHLVLFWAGAGHHHMAAASVLLQQMSQNLNNVEREEFWNRSLVARLHLLITKDDRFGTSSPVTIA